MTLDRLSAAVRPARTGDAAFVADLIGGMGYDVRADDVRVRLGDLPEHDGVFVAETGDRVVGWVHVVASHSLIVAQHAEIAGLAVAADLQGIGIGPALMHHAERWAQKRGLCMVRVRSRDDRVPAHHFYRALGYAEVKKQLTFAKQLAPPASPDDPYVGFLSRTVRSGRGDSGLRRWLESQPHPPSSRPAKPRVDGRL